MPPVPKEKEVKAIEYDVECKPLRSEELALEPVFAHVDRRIPSALEVANLSSGCRVS